MPFSMTAHQLTEAINRLQKADDAETIAEEVTAVFALVEPFLADMRKTRQFAVLELRAQGKTWTEIGDITGVGRARLNQIARGINGGRWDRQRTDD